jgi:serine phosphatase RsbU (regulator of sigma subunit)
MALYTDGIVEASNPQGEAYGTQRLIAAACRGRCSPQQVVDRVNGDLLGFAGEGAPEDDQTLLVLRVK